MKPRKPLRRTKVALRARTPLKRGLGPKRGKRLKPVNLARARKRQDAYQKYLRSPEWAEKKRLVRERSGGRCEWEGTIETGEMYVGNSYWVSEEWGRCPNNADDVHHKTYRHFKNERLSELQHLCRNHHDQLEAEHPTRQARRQSLARSTP